MWVGGVLISYPLLKRSIGNDKWTLEDRVRCIKWSLFSFFMVISMICVFIDNWYNKNKDKPVKW